MDRIVLNGNLTIEEFISVAKYETDVEVSKESLERVKKSSSFIDKIVEEERVVYGVSTGFGKLVNTIISKKDLTTLQENLIKSHSSGVGKPLPYEIVRGIILLRLNTIIQGYSGVQPQTVDFLVNFLNKKLYPYVPSKGSVGASGDLAPLAHIVLNMMGMGLMYNENGDLENADKILKRNGIKPLVLHPKEGLALINGTQVMTSIGLFNYIRSENIALSADFVLASSLDAFKATPLPYDERVYMVRKHRGQKIVGERVRKIIKGSEIRESHKEGDGRVQDPYSFRCALQVHGAFNDTLEYVKNVLEIEMNSVTDNPLIFADEEEVISAGNFHGEPVAFAMDYLSIALSEIGNISDRRIAWLISGDRLPPFLVKESGLNSGFMIPQTMTASLVSENKVLSHPASVDSVPTSANQEDHVSMGTIAARKAGEICENVEYILATELLSAFQGIEFHRPMKSSPIIEEVMEEFRKEVPFMNKDRYIKPDIEIARKFVTDIIPNKLKEIL